jgi:hypothetical protein
METYEYSHENHRILIQDMNDARLPETVRNLTTVICNKNNSPEARESAFKALEKLGLDIKELHAAFQAEEFAKCQTLQKSVKKSSGSY